MIFQTGEKSHKNRGYKFVPNDTVTISVELNNQESHSEPVSKIIAQLCSNSSFEIITRII